MPISSVSFHNFKALSNFSLSLQSANVLVGPNNSGKSTILSSFRVLEHALRIARSRKASRVRDHNGDYSYGHILPTSGVPISMDNVHSDYSDADSRIDFRYSDGDFIHLYFPADGGALLYWRTNGMAISTPTQFKRAFPEEVNVVPVLGPVEQDESIVKEETVRRAAGTPTASRHFRNYWRINPDGFEEFKSLIEETWPGMSIGRPEVASYEQNRLAMYVSENRIDRELFWAGLGFQVWCQLLTYISRYRSSNLLVIDEPEIYLHPEVQRQLLSILRDAKPDIILATHSVEILSEADPSEILLVDKSKRSAQRLRDVEGVQQALEHIGSVQNITLTELARSRRLLFVEGTEDYKIFRRFAKRLGYSELAAGHGLTAIPSEGFGSWDKIRGLSWGLKKALSSELKLAAVFDRDYRSYEESQARTEAMAEEGVVALFHRRKEIENYLLDVPVLVRTVQKQISRRSQPAPTNLNTTLREALRTITDPMRSDCSGQFVTGYCDFHARRGKARATLASEATAFFDTMWDSLETRLEMAPGKRVLSELREKLQQDLQITITNLQIIDSYRRDEIPSDLANLIRFLDEFRKDRGS